MGSGLTLNPAFDPHISVYTANAPTGTSAVSVTFTKSAESHWGESESGAIYGSIRLYANGTIIGTEFLYKEWDEEPSELTEEISFATADRADISVNVYAGNNTDNYVLRITKVN